MSIQTTIRELWSERRGRFAVLLSAFLLLFAVSWPTVLSFRLWVLVDRGNLLNLDYLLESGMHPATDTFYSYGLLPVMLQHALFSMFGRGYAPMLGFSVAALVVQAYLWARLLEPLPRSAAWLVAVACIVPQLLWVNPNFPYSLVMLSMLGALVCLQSGAPARALVAAAVGCWSVPSLPLVLVMLIVVFSVVDLWQRRALNIARLFRTLGPGAATYLALGILLTALYGLRPVLMTALPLQGAQFYAAKGYGLRSLREFLSPEGAGPLWWFGTRSAWWIFSTGALVAIAAVCSARMIRRRALDPLAGSVVILAVLHVMFALAMYGPPSQHMIYDPLLAGGVLLGLTQWTDSRLRSSVLAAFAGLAVLGHAWQARDTWRGWREQEATDVTAGLYAPRDFASEWQKMVDLSKRESLLLLTYGTGAHHYFPSVQSPSVWFFEVGLMLPEDQDRVYSQLTSADVVVQFRADKSFADLDPRMSGYIASMCPVELTEVFRISRRPSAEADGDKCAHAPF